MVKWAEVTGEPTAVGAIVMAGGHVAVRTRPHSGVDRQWADLLAWWVPNNLTAYTWDGLRDLGPVKVILANPESLALIVEES